jgi:hypothetical protein
MTNSFWSGPASAWFVALGTLVLAVVAVFQQWLQRLVIRPRLELAARVRRPDAEKTQWRSGVDVYYFRLAVKNIGNAAVNDVEVYLGGVDRLRADGQYEPVERFSPMRLKWAHTGETTRPILLPKMPPVFCDMAHAADPSTRQITGEDLPWVNAGEAVLGLDLEVKAFSKGYLLEPGTYQFHLTLAASNHAPHEYTLEVVFPGKWFVEQEKMFSEGFGMRLL